MLAINSEATPATPRQKSRTAKKSGFEIQFCRWRKDAPPVIQTCFFEALRPRGHYAVAWLKPELVEWRPLRRMEDLDRPGGIAWEIQARLTLCDCLDVVPSGRVRDGVVINALAEIPELAEHHAVDHCRAYRDLDGRSLYVSEPYVDGRGDDAGHANRVYRLFCEALPGWGVHMLPMGTGAWYPPRTRSYILTPPPSGWSPAKGAVRIFGVRLEPSRINWLCARLRRAPEPA